MEVIKPTEVPAVKSMLDRINTALRCGKFKICISEKDSAIISIVKTICQKEWDITSRHDDDLDDTALVPSGPLYWHFSVKKGLYIILNTGLFFYMKKPRRIEVISDEFLYVVYKLSSNWRGVTLYKRYDEIHSRSSNSISFSNSSH